MGFYLCPTSSWLHGQPIHELILANYSRTLIYEHTTNMHHITYHCQSQRQTLDKQDNSACRVGDTGRPVNTDFCTLDRDCR
jgi:hypothetical protein